MGSLPDIYKKVSAYNSVRWSGITPVADTNEIGIMLKRHKPGGKVHRFRMHVDEAKILAEQIMESLAGFPSAKTALEQACNQHSQSDKSSEEI